MACDNYCSVLTNKMKQLLKMSLVPLPCQAIQLKDRDVTACEELEWVMDLRNEKDPPIWSRLHDINTSGHLRKLPTSMTRLYDIEIEGRLWSLWGHGRATKKTKSVYKEKPANKTYLAANVILLCAAKTFPLNKWTDIFLDCIYHNGEKYLQQSLDALPCDCRKKFKLQNLLPCCCLESIKFMVCISTVLHGTLYGQTYKGNYNLAYSLIKFFNHNHFGLLECCGKYLAFGFISGREGGYFMFDAQMSRSDLIPKNQIAPYILRTNYLQVLLYCMVVTLNVTRRAIPFSIHNVAIERCTPEKLIKSQQEITSQCSTHNVPNILPSECWLTPTVDSASCHSIKSQNVKLIPAVEKVEVTTSCDKPKYIRPKPKILQLPKTVCSIIPLVDPEAKDDKNIQIKKDFLRVICSQTEVQLTAAEMQQRRHTNDFVIGSIEEALILGPVNARLETTISTA